MNRGHAKHLRGIIEAQAANLTDDVALTAVELFPTWESGSEYAAGDRVRCGGILYKCLTAHTSQDDWTPAAAPALWAKVLIPDERTIPAWEQPDSTNPYMTGDKVRYDGAVWVSITDNNVWQPGVYGWEAAQ